MEASSSLKDPEPISCSSSTSPWYSLSDDLGILILELLPLSDYIRFACVCQNWRSIQKYHRRLHSPNPPPMLKSLPWVMLNLNSPNLDILQFYSHSDSKVIHLDLPNAALGTAAFSCSKYWIFLINRSKRVLLLNPLTSSQIQLPPIYTVPFHFSGELSSSPLDPNCIALILNPAHKLVCLCRVGEKQRTWTYIKISENEWNYGGHNFGIVQDGAFYCNGKFYCFANGLYVIDPTTNNPSRRKLNMDCSEMAAVLQIHYLMEFRGELMLVAAIPLICHMDFQVFRADSSRDKWRRMNDVVDLVFFVSKNGSVCLSASDVGCKGNCVYYKDGIMRAHTYRVFDKDSKQLRDGLPFDYDQWLMPSLDFVGHE